MRDLLTLPLIVYINVLALIVVIVAVPAGLYLIARHWRDRA